MFDRKGDKRCYSSTKYDEDLRWLYFSQSFKDWMCKICGMYPCSSEPSNGALSRTLCQNTSHTSYGFEQYANSNLDQRLEKKLTTNGVYVYDQIITAIEKINLNKKHHVNQL